MKRGGKREGSGRKPGATRQRQVRCTDEGWAWGKAMAEAKGFTSLGKWLDAKGRSAPKRKTNVQDETTAKK